MLSDLRLGTVSIMFIFVYWEMDAFILDIYIDIFANVMCCMQVLNCGTLSTLHYPTSECHSELCCDYWDIVLSHPIPFIFTGDHAQGEAQRKGKGPSGPYWYSK